MKKACLLLLTFVFIAFASKAQDIITLTSGTQIQAKVLEINPGDVKYKDYNNADGPVITILKSTVAMIQYANGTKTIFSGAPNPPNQNNTRESSVNFKKDPYVRDHRKGSPRSEGLNGWYFGAIISLGVSNATSTDPTYSTSGAGYTAATLLATKMFTTHLGIQFGLGSESYNYNIADISGNYPGATDVLSLSCFSIPARVIYFSNSKHRAGFYAIAGLDLSFVALAKDSENDDFGSYYKSALVSPYLNCGVAFRNRYGNRVWMFGPFYKTTMSNFYSLKSGNDGLLHSVGFSIAATGKLGRR